MARERVNEGGRRDRKGRRWPVALPNALAMVGLLAAIALGATTVGAIGLVGAVAPVCQDEQGNVIDCPSAAPTPPTDGQGGGTEPTPPAPTPTPPTGDGSGAGAGSTDGTGSGAGAGSTDGTGAGGSGSNDEPKPSPKPHPRPQTLGLTLSNVDGGVKVDWTECKADGFAAYKIVRSTDRFVRWPRGWHDRLIKVITDQGQTEFVDTTAPAGKKVWYRVFCVSRTDHGFKVLDSSPAKSIRTPHETPPPAPASPVSLSFEAGLGDGGVVLHWEVCKADGFHWYKVVRSHGDNPSYVPHTDGTELIGIIENSATTAFTDTHVESGQTWFYRVQCVAYQNGEKVLLGQTAALQVTIP